MKLILDRINKNANGKRIFAFEGDNGVVFINEDSMPKDFPNQLFENVIIECEYKNNMLINPVVLLEETKEREEKMKNRLSAILNKRKK